jgi:hypothetical protein
MLAVMKVFLEYFPSENDMEVYENTSLSVIPPSNNFGTNL